MFGKYIQSFFARVLWALRERYINARRKHWAEDERMLIAKLQKEEQELSVPVSLPPSSKKDKKKENDWQEQVAALRSDFGKKFSRLVIWGQRDIYRPYRFIHRACYYTAKRLGIPTIWLEDVSSSNRWLFPGDLMIIAPNHAPTPAATRMNYARLLPGVFYCVDRTYSHALIRDLDKEQYLLRQEHRNSLLFGLHGPKTIRLPNQREGAYYNPELNLLCQPYGTDLLPWEFMPPVFPSDSKQVNYVGSKDSANMVEPCFADFAKYLKNVGLHLRFFDEQTNARHKELIRRSRLAPMLGGLNLGENLLKSRILPIKNKSINDNLDLEENYPHCRMFKNISYGQLGYSNIPIHQEIYKNCHPPVGSIEEMSDHVLGMSESDYTEMVHEQQKVTQNYTLLQYLANLFKYF